MRILLIAAALCLAAGCASNDRGVMISLGGTDCCTAMYIEDQQDDEGGALAFYNCLKVDLDADQFLHDADCSCHEQCICWEIARRNQGQRPKAAKKVEQLFEIDGKPAK